MALDLGTVRTGVALSDPTHTIATPSDHPAKGAEATGFVDQIRHIAEADAVERIIVGAAAAGVDRVGRGDADAQSREETLLSVFICLMFLT